MMGSLLQRFGQGSFDGPTSVESVCQGGIRQAGLFCPITNTQRSASELNTARPVMGLAFWEAGSLLGVIDVVGLRAEA